MLTIDEFHVKYGRLPTERDPAWNFELERAKLLSELQIIDRPIMAPGQCMLCGASQVDGRKYIDSGIDLEIGPSHNYVPYICSLCVRQLAELLHMFDTEEKEPTPVAEGSLNEKLNEVSIAVDNLLGIVQDLKEEIDGLVDSDSSDSSADSPIKSGGRASVDDKSTKSNSTSLIGAEPAIIESFSGRRSTNVPSLDSVLKPKSK